MANPVTTILAPDGTVANYSTDLLSDSDAMLFRTYKKWLNSHGYKETLYCIRCFEKNLAHGCEAYVTPDKVWIKCRCRLTYHQGQTF